MSAQVNHEVEIRKTMAPVAQVGLVFILLIIWKYCTSSYFKNSSSSSSPYSSTSSSSSSSSSSFLFFFLVLSSAYLRDRLSTPTTMLKTNPTTRTSKWHTHKLLLLANIKLNQSKYFKLRLYHSYKKLNSSCINFKYQIY